MTASQVMVALSIKTLVVDKLDGAVHVKVVKEALAAVENILLFKIHIL